jgi:hypothetical protein
MSGRHLVCAAAMVFASAVASLPARAEPRAVLELFTSQGCSSCPAADKLLAQFAVDPSVIALTLAIDYWDYLGWKDTFGAAAHTARQEGYARARGGRGKFTPEMIVNGAVSATGSDRAGIVAAIDRTASHPGLFAISVALEEKDGRIEIGLEQGPAREAEVWLFALASHRTVKIERGENESRTVTYTNVVRKMTRLGAFTGKPAHFSVPRANAVPADADRYIVLVQEGSGAMPGPILGVRLKH